MESWCENMKNKKNNIDFGNLMVIGIIGGVLSIILYFIYMLDLIDAYRRQY